jgi:DNA replication protein DnaC
VPWNNADEAKRRQQEREAAWEAAEKERQRNIDLRRRNAVWTALCEERGPRYSAARFSNFQIEHDGQKVAVEKLQQYAADAENRIAAGESVWLIGPAGTGKDHLMFALCYAAVAAFKSVLWVNGSALWLAFREAINSKGKTDFRRGVYGEYDTFDATLHGSEASISHKLAEVDVLAISDPLSPSGPLTDYQAETLLRIIDRRYSHMRPTFLTINCASRQEAEQRMGAAVVDRLAHDALVVACSWPSYRQRKDGEGKA